MKELLIYLTLIILILTPKQTYMAKLKKPKIIYWWKYCTTEKKAENTYKDTIAYTNSENNNINVCNKDKFTKETLAHEVSHIIYNQLLNNDEKKIWQDMYKESKSKSWILKVKWFVNIEAEENELEDFAETFVDTYLKKGKSAKWERIKAIIKKNTWKDY